MKNNNNDNSKPTNNYNNIASGIKYRLKVNNIKKNSRKEFSLTEDYSCDIEIDEKIGNNSKRKNEIIFKPSTKQTIDKNEFKRFKERFMEADEIKEEKEDDEKNSSIQTPPSRVRNKIYTEKNFKQNNKVINDSDEEKDNKIILEDKLNSSIGDEKEEENKDNENKELKNNKLSKGIKSEGGDFENKKIKNKKSKKKGKKWNEEEFQKLKSESKNYLPFKEYDINKYLLTLAQMNNIKQIPELYDKYMNFLSLKRKQDQTQKKVLLRNIIKGLNHIYKRKVYEKDFKVNTLINEQDLVKQDYKSSEKEAYFDLFICFITMYVNGFENLKELTSMPAQTKLLISFHTLAYIFSSQIFFSNIAKLIQYYYEKFLAYKIIPIYIKENEEYRYRINSRKKIWNQFENIYFYNKNNKKLYLNDDKGKAKINDIQIEKFSKEIKENVKIVFVEEKDKIIEKHQNLNQFNIKDEIINIGDSKTSAPSSIYNQINEDKIFKIKMNIYNYKMRNLNVRKNLMIHEAHFKKNEVKNMISDKIFKHSIFYMNPVDIVQDFLDNWE